MKHFGVFLCLVLCGCELTRPVPNPNPPAPPTPIVERAPADEVFASLGNAVAAKQIRSMSVLARTVAALVNNGDLSVKDATAFDLAFPNATTSERDLTTDDVAKLKGLK